MGQSEKQNSGGAKRSLGPRRASYGFWLTVFSIASNSFMLVMPIYLSQIYDRVLPSSSLDTLIYLSLFVIFCLLIFGMMESLRNDVAQKMSIHYELERAPKVLDFAVRSKKAEARDLAKVLSDVIAVRQFVSSRHFIGLFDLPFAPLFLAILYLVHPFLGILAAIGGGLLVLIALANEFFAGQKQSDFADMDSSAKEMSREILVHLDDVRAMGMGNVLTKRWSRRNLDAALSSNEVSRVNGSFFGLVRFVRQGIQVGILGSGAYLVLAQDMSAGLIFAASIVSGRALMPIEQVIGGWRQLSATWSAHKRIKQAFAGFDQLSDTLEQIDLPEMKGQIECENVTYAATGQSFDKALLKKVNFRIEPGEVVAIIGPSGAGKTTLLRVLASIIRPSAGKVKFDEFDAAQWDAEQLGFSIGYAGQEIDFFRGSVSENIARFREGVNDEQIVEAAQFANAHEFIGSLPQGYSTQLNKGEFRLSGGQKQRISLARAFFGDPQIILLDEPDAHLDQDGVRALQEAIERAKERGKTIVFVTQRMNLVGSADKVLALENGAVFKYGPRNEVLQPQASDKKRVRQLTRAANKGMGLGGRLGNDLKS